MYLLNFSINGGHSTRKTRIAIFSENSAKIKVKQNRQINDPEVSDMLSGIHQNTSNFARTRVTM